MIDGRMERFMPPHHPAPSQGGGLKKKPEKKYCGKIIADKFQPGFFMNLGDQPTQGRELRKLEKLI